MARRDYRSKSGEKLPGVTNIIDILNKPALVFWGYKQGLWNFERLSEFVMSQDTHDPDALGNIQSCVRNFEVRKLYDERDKAANAGTLAHNMIECYLKNDRYVDLTKGYDDATIKKAQGCFEAFKEWARAHRFSLVESEKPLVSKNGYGGTLDIAAVIGDLNIVDIKTSNGIYFSAKVQVAAYGRGLWEENFPDRPIKGYRIQRLGAEGDFSDHYFQNLDAEYEVFLACLKIYQILKETGQKL